MSAASLRGRKVSGRASCVTALLLCCAAGAFAQSLVVNGDFEEGIAGWQATGSFRADARFGRPASGSGYAYLARPDGSPGNSLTGTLSQRLVIPSPGAVVVSFSFSIDTYDGRNAATDVLHATLQTSTGTPVATLAVLSNVDAGLGGGYQRREFRFTATSARELVLHFAATTDESGPTIFRLDDVSCDFVATATSRERTAEPDPLPSVQVSDETIALQAETRSDWEAAAAAYRTLLAEEPQRVDLWIRLSDVEAARGDRVAAAEALTRATELRPEDAALHAALSAARANANQPRAAFEAIERAIELEEDSADHWLARAQLANWLGDYDEALRSYSRVTALGGESRESAIGRAMTAAWKGNIEQAVKLHEDYLRRYPDDPQGYLLLARAQRWRGNVAAAAEVLDRYEERFPAGEGLAVEKAWVYARDQPRRALELLALQLERRPDDTLLQGARATALMSSGRPRDSLDQLAMLDPSHPDTFDLWRGLTTALRSKVGPHFEIYDDSDSIRRHNAGLSLEWSVAPAVRLLLAGEETSLDAEADSGLGRVLGSDDLEVRRARAGVDVDSRVADVEVSVGSSEITNLESDLTTFSAILTLHAGDRFDVGLGAERDHYLVSPRAVETDLVRESASGELEWRPDLRWTLGARVAAGDFSDGNESVEWVASLRRAVARNSRLLLDLGLRANQLEFDRSAAIGYYSPLDYERYAVTVLGYWKISEQQGLGFSLSPGAFRDETLDDFEFGFDAGLEWTVGIFADWQLAVRGGYTENSPSGSGAFNASSGSFQLVRRFSPGFVRRTSPER